MSQDKCPYCGGSEIVANIRISQTAEVGKIGLSFKTAMILVGTEPILADLCSGCGSVTRFHVKNTDRKWMVVEP
jgi:hypothetical protein